MLFITTQHIDLFLSLIGFVAGMALLVSRHVDTRALRQAFPILFGMVGWLIVFLLASSALIDIPLTGATVRIHSIWGYVIYKLLFIVVWLDYLRKTAIHKNTNEVNMKESTIKNLQATMQYHAFYEGEVDGNWGNQSQAAFYAMAEAAANCEHREEASNVNLVKPTSPVRPNGEFYLSSRSAAKLEKAHPHLRKVVERAIKLTPIDFTVGETLRSIKRQKHLLATGKSTTMNSRHLPGSKGYSFAVDLYVIRDGIVSNDMEDYRKVANAMKQAAKELKVPLEWGGDWRTFKDGPHFQLPWSSYGRND